MQYKLTIPAPSSNTVEVYGTLKIEYKTISLGYVCTTIKKYDVGLPVSDLFINVPDKVNGLNITFEYRGTKKKQIIKLVPEQFMKDES